MSPPHDAHLSMKQLLLVRRVRDRIERAMTLIRRGDLSITDICVSVGFSSLGTFSTRFSELVGLSPSRYRAALAEGDHDLPTFIVKNVFRPVRNREVPPL